MISSNYLSVTNTVFFTVLELCHITLTYVLNIGKLNKFTIFILYLMYLFFIEVFSCF